MQKLRRPGGVEIAWDSAGEGPLIVVANQFFSTRDVFSGLLDDLASDHRVVWYDARGTGESTRPGPCDMQTDVEDLQALIEHVGGPALLLAMADGCNRAVHLAAARPDLVSAVVTPAGNPVGRTAAAGTDALVASQSVLDALLGMMRTDYRGALNSVFSTSNPELSDAEVRERVAQTVAHCAQDTAVERMHLWIYDDTLSSARAVGDRLWILEHGTNPWFTGEIAKHTRELLPEANVLEVDFGAVSRPDIAAAVVRKVLGEEQLAAASEARQAGH
jgi:pimeloyl-ACP methyl ester carboxylesterase